MSIFFKFTLNKYFNTYLCNINLLFYNFSYLLSCILNTLSHAKFIWIKNIIIFCTTFFSRVKHVENILKVDIKLLKIMIIYTYYTYYTCVFNNIHYTYTHMYITLHYIFNIFLL